MQVGLAENWLAAAGGVLVGTPGDAWEHHGRYQYVVNAIVREPDGSLVVGSGNGLWRVTADPEDKWIQLHDETLTEVLTVAQSDVGLVAGSPYGVSVSTTDENGYPRWRSLTEHLRVNARFTNAILVDPADSTRWLVGTEGGVILGHDNGETWEETDLSDTAVRSVIYHDGVYWAGSDDRGLLCSEDGRRWKSVWAEESVFAVATSGDRLILGTERGFAVGARDEGFSRTGPHILIRCVAVDPADPDVFVGGADPGGMWTSKDAGQSWTNTAVTPRVRNLYPPRGDA